MSNNNLTKEQKLNNIKYLILLLRSVLNESFPLEPNDEIDFDFVFKLAKSHSVANTAFYAVEQLENRPSGELYKEWQDLRNKNVHRNLVQTIEYQSVTEAFKKYGVEFLPIKGLPLCNLYPKPDYREMSDLDFLIKDDLSKAGEAVANIGYSAVEVGDFHHDKYAKPPFMLLELHREIVPINSSFYGYYEDIFQRSRKTDDCQYRMTDEDFFIFNLVHLYRHYSTAGCGIKMVMDMYVQHKYLYPSLNKKVLEEELEKLGLSEFFEEIIEIANKWFGKGDLKHLSKKELYILTSGTFGNSKNMIANRHKGKSKGKYVATRLFPPSKEMKNIYSVLRKHPYLLPFFYVGRIFSAPFTKGKKIKSEIDYMKKAVKK
ncbi:MAG: nucleotidyltransferase family protein [Ruminococcus sp.]